MRWVAVKVAEVCVLGRMHRPTCYRRLGVAFILICTCILKYPNIQEILKINFILNIIYRVCVVQTISLGHRPNH